METPAAEVEDLVGLELDNDIEVGVEEVLVSLIVEEPDEERTVLADLEMELVVDVSSSSPLAVTELMRDWVTGGTSRTPVLEAETDVVLAADESTTITEAVVFESFSSLSSFSSFVVFLSCLRSIPVG